MLRSAVSLIGLQSRSCAIRAFCNTAKAFAAAPPPKKQAKVVRKREVKEKIKKGGMTHLKFGEAVRQLNFQKTALDLGTRNVAELDAERMSEIDSKVVVYNAKTETLLREIGAFKKNQHHELFSNPVTLVTKNTKRIFADFITKLAGSSSNNRICLLGEKGSGKSTLIAQAQALSVSQLKSDVVLLHVDHAEKIVDGSSDFYYNSVLGKFHQPMFTKRWIKKVRTANADVFKKMLLTEDVTFVTKKVKHALNKDKHTLFDFLQLNHEFGFFGPSSAFQFFIKQLNAHSECIPVLVSIDNFNSIIGDPHTKYFHTDMRPVTLAELEFGDFILNLVSGDLSFQKGGILLAESKDSGECKTLRVGLKLEAPNPYDESAQCHMDFAEKMTLNGGVKPFSLQNISKPQAKEFLTFLNDVGVLQVRQYPTKEQYKSLEEGAAAPTRTIQVGEYVRKENADKQFEIILESSFFASAGNPGRFLKINNMTF